MINNDQSTLLLYCCEDVKSHRSGGDTASLTFTIIKLILILVTVLNSSQTRILFFVLEFLVTCQTKRKYNHLRKTRSASDSSCGWLDPVKNLGDYMCRKPKTAGPIQL